VALMADTERIVLDSTFTGKALSAMLRRLVLDADLREEPVLFWHTYTPPRGQQVQRSHEGADVQNVPVGYRRFRDQGMSVSAAPDH